MLRTLCDLFPARLQLFSTALTARGRALASSIVAGRFTTEGNSLMHCSGYVPEAYKQVAAARLDPHGGLL